MLSFFNGILCDFLQEEKAKVIQTVLFVSGLNTLLQTSFGTRLPAVIGGSYTFVAPTISIILSGRWEDPDPVSVGLFIRNESQHLNVKKQITTSFKLLCCLYFSNFKQAAYYFLFKIRIGLYSV